MRLNYETGIREQLDQALISVRRIPRKIKSITLTRAEYDELRNDPALASIMPIPFTEYYGIPLEIEE